MSFLEQLGRKLSDVGQEAAQQTKSLTDRARLSNAIFEREKQIRGWYAEIGRAYYLEHARDPEALCREQMEAVTAAIAANEADREKLDALRGTGKCPSCGVSVPDGAQFCPSCGAALPRDAEDQPWKP